MFADRPDRRDHEEGDRMRVVGILGGMSWESTLEYYRVMNEEVSRRLGGLSSARILLSSVDFAPLAAAMAEDRWGAVLETLIAEARRLAEAGAEALVVATNTMHRFASELEESSGIPLLHIADAAGAAAKAGGVRSVGLMGTKFTMEGNFYRERLERLWGLQVLVPEEGARREINRVIFGEHCAGIFKDASTRFLLSEAETLASRGAQGVILGCTELPLVMKEGDASVPLWDTSLLHARMAVDFMLGGRN